jgi:hypothetical protein
MGRESRLPRELKPKAEKRAPNIWTREDLIRVLIPQEKDKWPHGAILNLDIGGDDEKIDTLPGNFGEDFGET